MARYAMPGDIVWVDDDGVVHVRNSERGTLDRCPQQWWWAWRDGLRPKEVAKPLWFGTAIHEALAHYYGPGRKRRKSDFIDKFRESADMEAEYMRVNVGGVDEDAYVEARLLGETMLKGYIERWDGDKDWDVIATEQTFEIAIPYAWTPQNRWLKRAMEQAGINTEYFLLNGTFDGVYRDKADKRVKLMEHKTAASISIGHLPMDNQAGTYWLVAMTVGRDQGWLGAKDNIHEITYNFLRKAMPDERPKDKEGYATNKPLKVHYIDALATRGIQPPKSATIAVMEEMAAKAGLVVLGDRSKSQPPPLFERHPVRKNPRMRRTQLHRLQVEVLRMNALVLGAMDVTKSPSRDHCGFCSFRDMCELHESGAGWTEFRDALYRASDPYADHRKSASGA